MQENIMTLKELLGKKVGSLMTIEPSSNLLAAVQKMCELKVGALLVQNTDGDVSGIITERYMLRFCATHSSELATTSVQEIMTSNLVFGALSTDLDSALSIMSDKRFRHLPVADNGKVVGLVSIGDLVKAKLDEAAFEAKNLREYISQ
jgi:CBS domain-containing protein